MARFPKYVPTDAHRREVLTMTGFGITQLEIATMLGISDRSLRTHYRRELDTGATEANMRVAQSLYNMATRDKVPSAAMFWLKCRAGWREPPRDVNLGGQPDNPVAVDFQWAPALPPAPVPELAVDLVAVEGAETEIVWDTSE